MGTFTIREIPDRPLSGRRLAQLDECTVCPADPCTFRKDIRRPGHRCRRQGYSHAVMYVAALAWLLAAAVPVEAQVAAPSLHGRVIDRDSGKGIDGAIVEADGAVPKRVLTDSLGYFRLDFTADTAVLTVWRMDYARLDTVVVRGSAYVIVLALEQRPIPLRTLTVDADRTPGGGAERVLFEREPIPGVIGVSRHELREIPQLAEPDVLRSLQALPGVVALNDLSAQLHVWGGASDQNIFLLDGARIFAPYHMFGLFGAFNADAVERVEFYRTLLPARRGGALSASIEAQQRQGASDGIEVGAGLGLLGTRATVRGSLPWNDATWMVAARRTHLDAVLDVLGRDFPYAFHDLHGRIDLRIGRDHQLRLAAFGSADRFRMFLHNSDENLRSKWRNASSSVRWEWQPNPDGTLAAEGWGSTYNGSLTLGDGPTSPATANRVEAGGIRFEWTRRGTGFGLRIGADVEGGTTEIQGSGTNGGFISSTALQDFLQMSSYLESELRAGPLRLIPGARITYLTGRKDLLFEPRASARLYVDREFAVTVGAGRSYQAISTVRDDRYPVPGAPFWIAHLPGWPISRADGLAVELEGWGGDAWQIRISGYVRDFEDVPRWSPVGTRSIDQMGFDDGRAEGVEASIRKHAGRVTGWLGYGLGRVRITHDETRRQYFAAWDRRHAVDLAIFLRVWQELVLSGRAVYGSGLPFWPPAGANERQRFDPLRGIIHEVAEQYPIWSDRQERFPDYFRLDIGARHRSRIGEFDIEPYISLINVTGRPNVLYYSITEGRQPYEGTDVPRQLWLKPELQLPLSLFPSIGLEVRF